MPPLNRPTLGRIEDGTAKPGDELSLTGLRQVGGYIEEEFLPQLRGDKAVKVYREMSDNDAVVGAVLHAVDMLLRGVEWRVEPTDNSQEAEDAAQFVRECMEDLDEPGSWEDFISEVLSMLVFGWSYFEVVYKRRQGRTETNLKYEPSKSGEPQDPPSGPASSKHDDGRVGWHKLAFRAQQALSRWEIDSKGGIRGMWHQPWPEHKEHYLPITKCMLFRTKAHKNNPEGKSVLRNAYRAWFFKKRLEEIEGVGIERDLAGYPIAWIPAQFLADNASEEEAAIAQLFEDAVKNTRRDAQEGLVLPQQYDKETGNPLYMFELLSTGGTRVFDTSGIIERYDQRIAMVALADIILLGHEAVGSYALSTSKEGLLRASLTAWLEGIRDVLNEQELPRLWRVNGMDDELMPTFEHGEIDTPTPMELAEFIATLAGVGMPFFPNQKLENQLLDTAKLPTRDEEEWRALHEAQQMMMNQGQPMEDEEVVEEEVPAEEGGFQPMREPAGSGQPVTTGGRGIANTNGGGGRPEALARFRDVVR